MTDRRLAGRRPFFLSAILSIVLPVCAFALSACTPLGSRGNDDTAAQALSTEARSLTPLFEALLALENGDRSEPVVIIQIGDSHTAGDMFSGHLRALFQQRFGGAGRGTMPPGVPFDYYRPTLVDAEMSDGWRVDNSFSSDASGIFGLSGFRVRGRDADDIMTLTSEEPEGFDRIGVEYLSRPDGGTFSIEVDGRRVRDVTTHATRSRAERLTLDVQPRSHRLAIRPAGDGPVDLLSWTTERDTPGVILDSHGIVGSTVNIIGAWDPQTVAEDLRLRDPALVIVEYGTNEAFHDSLELAEYAVEFPQRLRTIRQMVPDAAVIVVGPPDANRLPNGCRTDRLTGDDFTCTPLSPSDEADYRARYRSQNTESRYCHWHTPPNLRAVREIQRAAAQQQGVYFWDWSQVMGGECGTFRWSMAEPPLAHGDRVHLKTDGHIISTEALFAELMAQYDAYRTGARGQRAEAPQ